MGRGRRGRADGRLGATRLAGACGTARQEETGQTAVVQEPNVCRGLNICKGHGKGGKNDCAGQGECATAKAHTCAGDNDCAGLGGCNAKVDMPGENKCKGMGGCAVPITDKAIWKKARANFETAMKKAGKKVGPAPKS